MKAKVCFNDEIRRISNVPENLNELKELVTSTFHTKLPQLWTLQYKDSDGDNIVITDEKDFEEFRNFALQANKGTSLIKIFIVPLDTLKISREKSDEIIQKPESEDEEFQIIDDVPESNTEELAKPSTKMEKEGEQVIEKNEFLTQEEKSPELKEEKEALNTVQQPEEEHKIEYVPVESKENQEAIENKEEIPSTVASKEENNSLIESASQEKVLADDEIIEKMLSSAIEKSLPKIIQSTKEEISQESSKKEIANKVVHYGIGCIRCGVMPIEGVRYKCSVCPNFDYCDTCEEICPHIHNFIKIREHSFLDALKENEASKPNNPSKEKKSSQKKKFEPLKEEPEPHYAEKNDYFFALKEKAEKVHKCFPKVDFELILAYVNGAPEDLSLEELVENYKH